MISLTFNEKLKIITIPLSSFNFQLPHGWSRDDLSYYTDSLKIGSYILAIYKHIGKAQDILAVSRLCGAKVLFF